MRFIGCRRDVWLIERVRVRPGGLREVDSRVFCVEGADAAGEPDPKA